MAHRGELGLGRSGPQQEAQVVGGHNQTADGQAEPLLLGSHPQHRRLEAVAHHYQTHAQQQGPGRGQAGPGLDQGAADYAGAALGGAHHRAAGHRRQRTGAAPAPTQADGRIQADGFSERTTGLEPATSTLARLRSTN